MGLHDNFAALAARLIQKNGRAIEIKTKTAILADAAKPWDVGTGLPTDFNISLIPAIGVFFDPEGATEIGDLMIKISQGLSVEDRTSITGEDTNLWIAANDLPDGVTPANTVVDGDTEWEIKSVRKLQPGPKLIAYLLEVSR